MAVLLVVGRADRLMIKKHKRLQKYCSRDYDVLSDFVAQAHLVYVTPNVMTETSNLARQGMSGADLAAVASQIACLAKASEEIFVRTALAIETAAYARLGLTDAVLLTLDAPRARLLTDDRMLYAEECRRRRDPILFETLVSER